MVNGGIVMTFGCVRWSIVLLAAVGIAAAPATAQIQTVDPNEAMQSDVAPVPQDGATPAPADPAPATANDAYRPPRAATAPAQPAGSTPPATADRAAATSAAADTYPQDDVFTAAEGVFGKGAEGLAKILENILKDQGQPNAYIAGREAGGAFVVGVRYGSGVMHHKVEGEREVFWTGPSLGLDVGGNGAKTFVLVYNLYDTQELYKRFPAAEGNAYFIGGFTASYMRRGDVVLIPIRLGVGWRLGANVGYMSFSEKSKILPF